VVGVTKETGPVRLVMAIRSSVPKVVVVVVWVVTTLLRGTGDDSTVVSGAEGYIGYETGTLLVLPSIVVTWVIVMSETGIKVVAAVSVAFRTASVFDTFCWASYSVVIDGSRMMPLQ
jgi:hypothetical protein